MNHLQVQMRPIAALLPYVRNARTHSDAQVAQIAASMVEFGWTNPILVDGSNGIIAGHGRLMAARQLGYSEVPVIELAHLTPNQKRAYILADNKLAENAGWDEELLRLELADLQLADYDLGLIGFDPDEVEHLLNGGDSEQAGLTDDDAVPDATDDPVTQRGDVWILGEHRVMCGDSTDPADLEILMQSDLADMAFTDPPYNVNYANTAKDKQRGTHRPILNDNLGEGFAGFLAAACSNLLHYTKGAVYIAMSSSELDTLQLAFRGAGGKWSTFIIWAKNTFTLGRADYQRQYEPILYGWRDGTDHYWCGARDQGDVWFINKPAKNDLHPTMKPVELVERAILNSSKTRDIVLDLFGGSGTTLIAAEKSNRRARLIELDPKYVDVIIKRWQDYSGKQAIRAVDGMAFDTILESPALACGE
ncbi:site-specific DNA-methyltransferase [Chitinibacter sp. GC72]|uniref:site-specific DNA-methyltransferase n=1 Tax=Chitinibacter sp. GC72 TaxID=1526917 RepID=UPI0012FC6760|nr:site-specific DNA-methyltransferase [Chitinibacter sp. GC72]